MFNMHNVPHTAEAKQRMSEAHRGVPLPHKRRPSQEIDGVTHWRCSDCKKFFPVEGFYKNRRTLLGITSACRKCHTASSVRARNPENTRRLNRESSRRMRAKDPDKYANIELRRAYGISLDEYTEMFNRQDGLCAICSKPETVVTGRHTNNVRRLAVDHCHATGRIRGLLCRRCNTLLGQAEDDVNLLTAAVTYLCGYGSLISK